MIFDRKVHSANSHKKKKKITGRVVSKEDHFPSYRKHLSDYGYRKHLSDYGYLKHLSDYGCREVPLGPGLCKIYYIYYLVNGQEASILT
jgi:hypothetical protein